MPENKIRELPARNETEAQFKWKLEDIYSSDAAWEEDFAKLVPLSKKLAEYKGKLGSSAGVLLECLALQDSLMSMLDSVYVYARMRRDEDNANPIYQALADRATGIVTEVSAAASFITPEITAIEEKVLSDFIASEGKLSIYRHFISDIIRQKSHILSEREEEILALTTEMAHTAKDVFTIFNNADIKFPVIKDENGQEVELTKGRYIKFLESKDRRVRKDSFQAMYSTYGKVRNTLASMLLGNIKKNRFYSKIRGYESCLHSALDNDNVTPLVYDGLIETVHKNLHVLKRYLQMRKKVLGLEDLHMYDLYVPMVEEPKSDIPYEEALKIVSDGLVLLGGEYVSNMNNGFNSGWIDVYENKGKTSGAYSWGAYSSHPYVLLNYQGTINDIFTIAHEMGHAMHTYYTNKSQPYISSGYSIFVAEVASTVNEALVMHQMLKLTNNKKEQAYLLNHYLEEFRTTLFRQTMFAEFEKIVHQKIESGEALTADSLCSIYRELNNLYYGEVVVVDNEIDLEWSRIPHFYNSFYVYKYATGISSAAAITKDIREAGKPAVDKYMQFLGSGASDYPVELLKKTGVDLSTPKPVENAMKVFEETLNLLESALGSL